MKIVLFQTFQFSQSTQFKCKYSLIVKVLFQANQFSQTVLIPLVYSTKEGLETQKDKERKKEKEEKERTKT